MKTSRHERAIRDKLDTLVESMREIERDQTVLDQRKYRTANQLKMLEDILLEAEADKEGNNDE